MIEASKNHFDRAIELANNAYGLGDFPIGSILLVN